MHYFVYLEVSRAGELAATLREKVRSLRGASRGFVHEGVLYSVVQHDIVEVLIPYPTGELSQAYTALIKQVKVEGDVESSKNLVGEYRDGTATAIVEKVKASGKYRISALGRSLAEARMFYGRIAAGRAGRCRQTRRSRR